MAHKKGNRKTNVLFNQVLLSFILFLLAFQYPWIAVTVVSIVMAAFVLYIYLWSITDRLKNKRVLQSSMREIDNMSGGDFEHYLSVLFEDIGYEVELTPASGDYGADLLLKKDHNYIAVQAKRYSKTVGIASVQQVFSAKTYYSANEAWVVTNNTFTKNACDLAKKSGVKLVDREHLIRFMTESKIDTFAPTYTITLWNEE
ncbi:restriction endonuclease [Domibacillus mangrovi]|uniref:Restriction endonuclease n=1 Tax=Domibacillus mangrovi TaxID=1714354 RepID=A0A1Q5P2X7_9BACI|nr:restriction endonuclease [Domibacillus mangrovi]OKL36609.1 restriction endonuclease [Domibacillus mangrovi]